MPAATGASAHGLRMNGSVATRLRKIFADPFMTDDPRIARQITLIREEMSPPPGAGLVRMALGLGMICHALFATVILSMVLVLLFSLSQSFCTVPWPWAILANAALIVQFPLAHSTLLTKNCNGILQRLFPGPYGATLATTTCAVIASAQLLALFTLWKPSEIIWWQAEAAIFGPSARPMRLRG